MILPAQTLRALQPIQPFFERARQNGMTFGLGPAGYDIRIAEDVTLSWHRRFVLASSIERFDMPNDLIGGVFDKSTWARRGVSALNTIVEPGWHGHLTLELTYWRWRPLRIAAGSPIVQIIFFRLEAPTEQPYAGKYQDQRAGPVPAIMEAGE
jgi:dCTP deaminase